MSLVAIPNVSEGRDPQKVAALAAAASAPGARVLDVHSDRGHHRSVFTVAGSTSALGTAMLRLATACRKEIDLSLHEGLHPRLGALDVCPFVGDKDVTEAVEAARAAARLIGGEGMPVLLYGAAARRPDRRELPDLRRGGLAGLIEAFIHGELPDEGPADVDPRTGVVCVGARTPLIAFNVWLRADPGLARRIAASIRASGGGLPGVRAIGLEMAGGWAQVSMNLTEPERTGIDDAFDAVQALATRSGVREIRGEIVGLPPARYMPDPGREAARRILPPGRSLEAALTAD